MNLATGSKWNVRKKNPVHWNSLFRRCAHNQELQSRYS